MSAVAPPTLRMERRLWRQGYLVAGVDEVGAAALAGPVVAAAVVLPSACQWFAEVTGDSKALRPNERLRLAEKIIRDSPLITFG